MHHGTWMTPDIGAHLDPGHSGSFYMKRKVSNTLEPYGHLLLIITQKEDVPILSL